jgi:hypothetical protein
MEWFAACSRITGKQHVIKRHISDREEHRLYSVA